MSADLAERLTGYLEAYVERCGDPRKAVYARLFHAMPALEALFANDSDGGVRGSMLQQAFDVLFDLAGNGAVAQSILVCERQNHDAYGVPESDFFVFFEAIHDELSAGLGALWTPQAAQDWATLMARAQGVFDPV